MTLNIDDIGDDSNIVPALVRLYDTQQISSLAKNKEPAARSELTSIITNLLEMDLSPNESELVADVLISLMRQIEHDLRAAIAERLSIMETVPLRLALHMANEEIHIAGPVLRNSKVFSDMDLIYIIKSKTSEYWQAIAQREEMSEQIMNVLADTKDFPTAIKLIENKDIQLSDHTLNLLVDIAQGSDEIAGPLLRRDEITNDIVKTLYRTVGMSLKHYIRETFQMFEGDVSGAVDEVTIEFVEAADHIESKEKKETIELPTQNHMAVAERFREKELLTVPLMLKTLKRGQYQSFVAQFSFYIGLSSINTHQMISQKQGRGLAVACKAAEIDRKDFISMHLLATRLRNKGGMIDVKELKKAVSYFDKMGQLAAKEIVEKLKQAES